MDPDGAGQVGPPSPVLAGLRVLAFCEFLPFLSCGGTDHVAWQVHRRLAKAGAHVTIVTCAPPATARIDEMVEGVQLVGVPSIDLAGVLRAEATLSPHLFREAFRVADRIQPDVIHVNSLHFQSSFVGALLGRRRKIPLVTTAHIGSLRHLGAGMRSAVSLYEQTVGRFILSSSRRVIAVSPSVGAHLRHLGVPADQLTVAPNGVDHTEFRPHAGRDARAVPRVAFVGRIIPNKGPLLLAGALGDLAARGLQFDAVFVGDGPSRQSVEAELSRRGVRDRVTFTGHVADVADQLRRADVLVRPSQTEGMPLAVLEAMASGVCVVASDADGNTDLIRDGENGLLFPVGRADRLADQLARVVGDPSLRRRLASAALSTAALHSWERCANATGAVLAAASASAG